MKKYNSPNARYFEPYEFELIEKIIADFLRDYGAKMDGGDVG